MKSIILYGSPEKLTNAHKPVYGSKQPKYYVRMDVVDDCDCERALRYAKPMDGEMVLNTTEIP